MSLLYAFELNMIFPMSWSLTFFRDIPKMSDALMRSDGSEDLPLYSEPGHIHSITVGPSPRAPRALDLWKYT